MNVMVQRATEHWAFVAPLLRPPANDAEYAQLVSALDELQRITGYDNDHPLDGLVVAVSHLIEAYDREHYPMPQASGVEVLRSFMVEHQLSQRDLPELGSQSTVSQLLAGKRKLNLKQVKALSIRFGVPEQTFLG